MEVLLLVVVAVVAIAVVTVIGQRLNVAGPLLLVAVGIAVSLLPFVHMPAIEPEWILAGVLPPLLYSSAVNLPAIEFRRDFAPISGLAVALVVLSSLVLGVFFWLAIPAVGLPLGIALGAILSPTDAVATSIVKRLGIAPRVVTLLDGESLLNDATALVLLRTAVVAIAGSFSLWGAIGTFVWGVLVAVVIGGLVGWLALRVRVWVRSSAANTAISFTVPFLASVPAEHLNGSGLVAAVVAGIVTGQAAARRLTPEQRLSDTLNWRTIELVLEGAVFLLMGLELKGIVTDNLRDHEGLWYPLWLALAALGIILVVRTGYVAFLVWAQGRRAARIDRDRLVALGARIDRVSSGELPVPERPGVPRDAAKRQRWLEVMRTRVARTLADVDYYQSSPLGWKHGVVIVWSGMRGVVTVAAAQTLTHVGAGQRALLVFIAFLVALVSLMLQGFTLPWVVRMLRFPPLSVDSSRDERLRMDEELSRAGADALADPALTGPDGTPFPADLVTRMRERVEAPRTDDSAAAFRAVGELRLVMIAAKRVRLDELSSGGTFSTTELRHALAELDAEELGIERLLADG